VHHKTSRWNKRNSNRGHTVPAACELVFSRPLGELNFLHVIFWNIVLISYINTGRLYYLIKTYLGESQKDLTITDFVYLVCVGRVVLVSSWCLHQCWTREQRSLRLAVLAGMFATYHDLHFIIKKPRIQTALGVTGTTRREAPAGLNSVMQLRFCVTSVYVNSTADLWFLFFWFVRLIFLKWWN
jgi:hypothetical protein